MDIKILDSWLRDYLDTKATPQKIGECLSLSGPSVERIKKSGKDFIYDIEITTNRIDTVSVCGIAREASAILPRFGISSKLKSRCCEANQLPRLKFLNKVSYLDAKVDADLCPRFTAVLIKNVKVDHSPDWMIERLEASGVRAINNVIDISNYIMLAVGQPVHTFDYDKIRGAKMILRGSKKGEEITTLDGKTFILAGGDIVIEDGEGRLIDLAGVMGGNLSKVDEDTKNVLLFVQTYNPLNIRKTSMSLSQRTLAATIFEKGIDPELVIPAILMGIDLFEKNCGGRPEAEILDIYPKPFKTKKISVDYEKIAQKLGVKIPKAEISKILKPLEFEILWKGEKLEVTPPSFRSRDILIAEDVIEEIARIYGYHNLPSILMDGNLSEKPQDKKFAFEDKVKDILSGFGGVEVYTLSLVPKEFTDGNALKLKNPLGSDSEYLRTSLMPSLIKAAGDNASKDSFHLFEMANVYLPKKSDLPEEKLILAGIFKDYPYRKAKGIVEGFLDRLKIKYEIKAEDSDNFPAGRSAKILSQNSGLGIIGETTEKLTYWEFSVEALQKVYNKNVKYNEISKYPSQVEDLTFTLPEKTKVGEIISKVLSMNRFIDSFGLRDVYKNAHTFRVEYHSDKKTLTDNDVEKLRNEIVLQIKNKFGGIIKN